MMDLRSSLLLLGAAALPLLAACGGGDGGGRPDTILAQEVGAEIRGVGDEGAGAAFPSGPTPPQAEVEANSQELNTGRTTALVRAANRVAPAVVSVNVLRQQRVRARGRWIRVRGHLPRIRIHPHQ